MSRRMKMEDKMSMFTERMLRAAKLDVSVYEEVEADTTAMGQAMGDRKSTRLNSSHYS